VRVLHILDHSLPIHSGYSFRTAKILEWQQGQGWDVAAITGPKHDVAEEVGEQDTAVPYVRVPYKDYQRRWPGLLKQLAVVTNLRDEILEVCRAKSFDLLHAHSPSLNGLAAIAAQRRLGLPLLYEMRASWEDAAVDHGSTKQGSVRYRLMRSTETHVLRRAAHITTICEGLKSEIRERGISDDRITVIPNAVDVDCFRPLDVGSDSLRERFDAVGRVVLVFCGSFYSYEGLSMLLRAVDELREKIPEILLLLAGGGPEQQSLEESIQRRNVGAHVRIVGRIRQHEVNELYNLADLCVFPRIPMRLTELVTPLKPLEAMAAGGIVLASAVGGHRELVSHGKNGFLFEAGDLPSLKSAIEQCLQSDTTAAVRQSARQFVVDNRIWSRSCDHYREAYRAARRVAASIK
jgi:PEP-CTERM/exosortase A-associated glycosyltransferase